jgi:azurin
MDRRDVLSMALFAGFCGGRRVSAESIPRVLSISTKGDLLEFSTQKMSCHAGSHVRVDFTNRAKYVNFEHNWVLIRPGTFDAVVAAAERAGEAQGWVPKNHPAVLAYSKMAHRGETVRVEFDAPASGRYLYLCTMPGHAASMWGTFTVT